MAAAGVKKLLNTVPVRKPSKEWFIHTNADPSYRLQTYVIELKEDSETYLVERSLWQELASGSTFSPRALFTAMNRQGVLFLWPIRLPGADGRLDDWSRSAMEAAQAPRQSGFVSSEHELGSVRNLPKLPGSGLPEWPDMPFNQLLKIAFRDNTRTSGTIA